MKTLPENERKSASGFSLVETLAALIIAAMVFTVLLLVYDRATEVLQRIAEDLDRLAAPGADTRITIKNKIEKGYQTAQLTIVTQIYDKNNKPKTFEKIIWQTNYDPDIDRLTLYRSHSGLALEDKLLDKYLAETLDRELFIPLCSGVTLFKIQVPQGDGFRDEWSAAALPKAVVATISFAEPFEAVSGELDVTERERTSRTIAIDRTRKIKVNITMPRREESSQPDKRP